MNQLQRHLRRLVRQKVRKPALAFLHGLIQHQCPDCKRTVEPFHTCALKSDFKRCRARQARAERRRLDRAKQAGKGGGPRRQQRGERRADHYKTCRDEECQRQLCVVYREGIAACPLPHDG